MMIVKRILAMLISIILFLIWLAATVVIAVLGIVTVFPVIALIAFPELAFTWLIFGFLILYSGGFLGEYQPDYLRSKFVPLEPPFPESDGPETHSV